MPEQDEPRIVYTAHTTPFSVYTNRVELNLTPWDVRMQIMEIVGKDGESLAIERHGSVVMSPLHAKALLRALESTIRKFEDRFGELDLAKLDEPVVEVQS